MRDHDLKRRLEAVGLTVVEVDGWRDRGSSTFDPKGSVNHHTAGPRTGTTPSLGVIINGRSDLPGPLANVYGPREESLRVFLVAAGRANHAGRGGWNGLTGNSSVYGLEEEHYGYPDEPISELRIDRMARVHAAFLWGNQTRAANTCQHWEWTSRKVDFLKGVVDPNEFRRRVQAHLDRLNNPSTEPPKDKDMALIVKGDKSPQWYITDGIHKDYVESRARAGELAYTGLARWNEGEAFVVPQGMVDAIPSVAKPDVEALKALLLDMPRVEAKAVAEAVLAALKEAL